MYVKFHGPAMVKDLLWSKTWCLSRACCSNGPVDMGPLLSRPGCYHGPAFAKGRLLLAYSLTKDP